MAGHVLAGVEHLDLFVEGLREYVTLRGQGALNNGGLHEFVMENGMFKLSSIDQELTESISHRIFCAERINDSPPENPVRVQYDDLDELVDYALLNKDDRDKITSLHWENKVGQSHFLPLH